MVAESGLLDGACAGCAVQKAGQWQCRSPGHHCCLPASSTSKASSFVSPLPHSTPELASPLNPGSQWVDLQRQQHPHWPAGIATRPLPVSLGRRRRLTGGHWGASGAAAALPAREHNFTKCVRSRGELCSSLLPTPPHPLWPLCCYQPGSTCLVEAFSLQGCHFIPLKFREFKGGEVTC